MKNLLEKLSQIFMYFLKMFSLKAPEERPAEEVGGVKEKGRLERTHTTYKKAAGEEGDFRYHIHENGVFVGIRKKGDRVYPVIIPEALPEPDS